MTLIGNRAAGRLEGRPSPFLRDGPFDCGSDEPTPAARPAELVDLRDQLVIELYVHSHVWNFTHSDGYASLTAVSSDAALARTSQKPPMPLPTSTAPITRNSTAMTAALLSCSHVLASSSGPRIRSLATAYAITGMATVLAAISV